MTPLAPGSTIGIVGGGQLGRMLAMAAARLGYRTVVLEREPGCPASQTANDQIVGDYEEAAALDRLAELSDVVTYEFENVPVEAAERLARSVPVFPPPRALEMSQDRLTEKTFLNATGVATARFAAVNSLADLTEALAHFGDAGVLKTRRLGYDGKGQAVLRDATPEAVEQAYKDLSGLPLILEEFVAFDAEISVIAARGRDGAMAAYDAAQNVHREGILRSSTVPTAVAPKIAEEARAASFAILEALDYVGVIGVEFFVDAAGGLLANEIAPRVHNSGHWTEAACAISQFEQHIRAVAGLPLGATRRHSDCVMENLIGDEIDRVPALLAEPDLMLHLYGKAEARSGRKMGHFTRLKLR